MRTIKMLIIILFFSLCLPLIPLPAFGADVVYNSIITKRPGGWDASQSYTVPSGYALKITSACLWLNPTTAKFGAIQVNESGDGMYRTLYQAYGSQSVISYQIGSFPIWVISGSELIWTNVFWTGVLYQLI